MLWLLCLQGRGVAMMANKKYIYIFIYEKYVSLCHKMGIMIWFLVYTHAFAIRGLTSLLVEFHN